MAVCCAPPMQAPRLQGMRVGHALSRLVNPTSSLLFEEERPWVLRLEEVWDDEPGSKRWLGSGGQDSAAPAATRAVGSLQGGVMAVAGRGSGAEATESVKGRRGEGDGGEGGPLTETDSDDELGGGRGHGGESMRSSSSSTDDEFPAHPLEESDEEGEAELRCCICACSWVGFRCVRRCVRV
jgi:hypothetical protein